jgi:hypothetical protein
MKKITMLLVALLGFSSQSHAQFPQGFEGTTFPPTGWTSFVGSNGLGTAQNWMRVTTEANTGTASAFVRWEDVDATVEDWLVTPQFTVAADAPYLAFWQRQQFEADYTSVYTIRVSTTSQTDISSFTTVSTEDETDLEYLSFAPKMVDLSAYAGQQIYVAFVMANNDGDNWFIDDVTMTALVTAPGCSSNPSIADGAIDIPVGNTTVTWDTVPAATGYDLYAGLAPDDLAFVASFATNSADIALSGYETTFYWQVVPKNAGGYATGCSVWSFTTELPPPVPINDACADAIAITTFPYSNTQNAISATNNDGVITACSASSAMNDGVWYTVVGNGFDLTVTVDNVEGWDPQVDVYTGTCGSFSCVVAQDGGGTGGTEQLVIEASALGTTYYINVGHYDGTTDQPEGPFRINVTTATDETPDYASVWFPASAPIVEGGTANVYGQVYEANLTDVEPGLTGQAAGIEAWIAVNDQDTDPSTWDDGLWEEMSWNGAFIGSNDEYMAAVGGGLEPGTYYYTTRFRLNNGPFVYGGITAGGDGGIWDGVTYNGGVLTISPAPAPSNDECASPIALTVGGTFADNDITATSAGATNNAADDLPSCGEFNFETNGKDVWFSVVVPASGSVTVETEFSGSLEDTAIEVYSGTCGALTSIDCNDDIDYPDNPFSSLSITDRTPGETLLVRVWGYNGISGGFNVSAFDASLGTPIFDNGQFSYYPNPVKNMLTLSHTLDISNVAVFNIVGQQVLAKSLNTNETRIDMSALPRGAYLVRVTVENQVKTIKVIKE